MIQILARETNVEFAGTGKFRIELLPVALFKTHESLLEYCHRKGYKKNGSGLDAEFTREEDLKPVRDRLKKYVDQPFKVYEKFIILEQELKE
ncbi:hypothetical protein GS518_13010 [Leptospira interrogans]|uniref:Uncharacterized protein n=15 Tax=Leptospira TaxID=171 RepID=Q8F784_LEPIN|nr:MULTISPECIES: hypothetical protein [Leptospira]EMG11320.1 hypothetical protein LEP1GSC151_1054 [Leptospira interrogans serovar Grippotyphosa str. LT2186]EMG19980.1 hypothetical protein LEP1GSC150_2136 [Leptospira interrogans serovar Copenhageni str. LT2050]EMM95963.1 hypothetical protein LEP1GSC158_0444 [Leptospira interrogans serovar Zanoni str. LT2156]EMN29195.1 hypothetical protein LEP1GSC083_0740 [Leptospira interrogans serovar Pyrogenes str. L0374]EMO03696.1 hypothetical protein LEP1GS